MRVAQRANSAPGGFRLDVYLPRLFPSAPGARLPKAGVAGRVDGLDNAADAYSAVLRAGITYRINLANLSSHRLVLSVFAPGHDLVPERLADPQRPELRADHPRCR